MTVPPFIGRPRRSSLPYRPTDHRRLSGIGRPPAALPFELAVDNLHGKVYVTDFNAGLVTQVDVAGGTEPFPTASTWVTRPAPTPSPCSTSPSRHRTNAARHPRG